MRYCSLALREKRSKRAKELWQTEGIGRRLAHEQARYDQARQGDRRLPKRSMLDRRFPSLPTRLGEAVGVGVCDESCD